MADNVLIVPNTLPVEFIALDEAKLDEAMALCQTSHDVVLPDSVAGILKDEQAFTAAFAGANATYKAIQKLENEIEESRAEVCRKIVAIRDRIIAVAREATGPLADQRARLGLKVGKANLANQELYRQRVAAAAKEAQEEETRRVAAAEAERQAQIDAAKAIAEMDAMPGEAPAPVTVDAFDGAGAASVRPVLPAYVPPPMKSAARIDVPKVLKVIDASKIPLEVSGIKLWTLDEKALEKCLKMGMKFPGGAELVDGQAKTSANGGGRKP